MRKILFFLAVTILILPSSVLAEKISSFTSDITLGSDGAFSVVETINYDFEDEYRHGIFRFIPTRHPEGSDKWFSDRIIDVEVLKVTMDNIVVPFEISENQGELEVKIGDPDIRITGTHTYSITYRVGGALFYYDTGAVDLYWNATGDGWTVPIDDASVRLNAPQDLLLANAYCYIGTEGENNPCSVSTSTGTVVFGSVALNPNEGLTVAQALDPSVATLIVERWSLWPLWLLGAIAWFMWLTWFLIKYARAHRTGASVIVQYEPYQDFAPMYTGVLFDGRVDTHDITAGIVQLAEQGFFKIKHVGRKVMWLIEVDDYEITLMRPYDELQTEFEKTLFALIFKPDTLTGTSVLLSELAADMNKRAENLKLYTELKAAAAADLITHGFFKNEWRTPSRIAFGLTTVLLFFFGVSALIGADLLVPVIVSVVVLFVSIIALLLVYRRRTRKGYEALDHLKGFKEFLSVTDKERFKFHNAPQKSPEQFMAYLPYAIAFGVEKEWAEAFKDITIPKPDWYDGNGHAFNAVYLSHSLGTFGSSMSSASGSSASSGGGSSGGGAGGGGGGSW